MTAPGRSRFDEVHDTVVATIIDVVGEEFYEELEIGLDSSLAEDVELESTEVAQIAERLMATYPEVDFIEWFADMDLTDVLYLTLGDLVDFIVGALEEAEAEGEAEDGGAGGGVGGGDVAAPVGG